MERNTQKLTVKERLILIPLGDIHWRTESCDEAALRDLVAWGAKEPDVRFIGMGDWWDSILPADPRFDAASDFTMLDQLWAGLATVIEPIKDKLLALHIGNHEYELVKRGIGNPILKLCHEWKIPYGGYASFFRLVAAKPGGEKSNTLQIYAHHGWFAGRKRGGKLNAMEDAAASYLADLYLFGHSHDTISSKRVVLTHHGARERAFVNSGTFMKTNTWNGPASYSERKGYPPTKVGTPRVEWYPWRERRIENKGRINGELRLEI